VPQIEVSFDIDANGIVQVAAKDLATSKEQAMTITGGTALPKEEIDRMVREAEQFADEDAKRRVEAEARNQADNLVYQTEKLLSENADKIPAGEKDDVQKALDEVKEALKGADVGAISSASERLAQAAQKVGQAMYNAQQSEQAAAGGAGGGAGTAGSTDDVVDAEVVDEGEENT
jgi:molecular chaperone DnaK